MQRGGGTCDGYHIPRTCIKHYSEWLVPFAPQFHKRLVTNSRVKEFSFCWRVENHLLLLFASLLAIASTHSLYTSIGSLRPRGRHEMVQNNTINGCLITCLTHTTIQGCHRFGTLSTKKVEYISVHPTINRPFM